MALKKVDLFVNYTPVHIEDFVQQFIKAVIILNKFRINAAALF